MPYKSPVTFCVPSKNGHIGISRSTSRLIQRKRNAPKFKFKPPHTTHRYTCASCGRNFYRAPSWIFHRSTGNCKFGRVNDLELEFMAVIFSRLCERVESAMQITQKQGTCRVFELSIVQSFNQLDHAYTRFIRIIVHLEYLFNLIVYVCIKHLY